MFESSDTNTGAVTHLRCLIRILFADVPARAVLPFLRFDVRKTPFSAQTCVITLVTSKGSTKQWQDWAPFCLLVTAPSRGLYLLSEWRSWWTDESLTLIAKRHESYARGDV